MDDLKRVVISGGGTGGHIFPAVSIANALRERFPDIDILFVGAEGRMEMERVPKAGYNIVGLPVSGFDRKHLLSNVRVLWRLWKSMRRARKVIHDFRPQIAVGVGGYASGPTLKAAQRKGIPTVLQEQNSYPGVTNKLLGKKAGAVCTAYEEAARFFPDTKVMLTGNPVRESLLKLDLTREQAKQELGFNPALPLVLVVGGSLGARTINESMAAGLERFVDNDVQLLWQTGKAWEKQIPEVLQGMPDSIKATPFIDDMGLAYKAADLVVARAGAGTISELQLLGKATVLVPSPNVAEDHQRKNAQALVNHDAAVMVLDSDAPTKLVDTALSLVSHPERLGLMSESISKMAMRHSAERIVDQIIEVLKKD